MKKTRTLFLISLILSTGCTHKNAAINNAYSCFDSSQQKHIEYLADDVYYTYLKHGIGVVAFTAANGDMYILHPQTDVISSCTIYNPVSEI